MPGIQSVGPRFRGDERIVKIQRVSAAPWNTHACYTFRIERRDDVSMTR
jgi:hypothetical protein